MLEINDLSKHFGGLAAVDSVSFEVRPGLIVGLIGPNGAGKTTLVNLITGFHRPSAGMATWRGRRLSGRRPERVAAAGVGRTFQQARLFPELSALDNVMVGAHLLGRSGFGSAALRLPRVRHDERRLRAAAARSLADLHCTHLSSVPARLLTTGQQRLVAIARALAGQSELVLLDEPAAGLNDRETEVLAADLRSLATRDELTVLVIEHHLGFVLSLSDEVVVMSEGRIIATGAPDQVRKDPTVIAAYIGVD